jgi:hypothetical protein
MLPLMRDAEYGDIYIGKDYRKCPWSANFIDSDDPHWAACVQSKRGKSNWLGLVAVQVLHQDSQAQVTVVDPKEESLIDFLGAPWTGPGLKPLIPGVHMANDANDVAAMIAAIHRARAEMDRRRSEYARDRTRQYSVHLVIVDELNLLASMVDKYWRGILAENSRLPKDEREDLPKVCPVWGDIKDMLAMGRFVGIHVLAVAQDFRADIIGGKGARNLFGLRALGGFNAAQWKMFIGPGTAPLAQRGKGRWIFWQGEQQDWVQITHCDKAAAYDFAAEGRSERVNLAALQPAETMVGSHATGVVPASILPAEITDSARDTRRVIAGVKPAAEYLGYGKWRSFATARSRRPVIGEFRKGDSPAWYADDLDTWYGERRITRTTDSEG